MNTSFLNVPFIITLSLLTTDCGGKGQLLGQTPVNTMTSDKPYEQVAACAFERLNAQQGSGVHKADLPTEGKSIVSIDTGATKILEVTFLREDKKRTRINVTSEQTMWGPYPVEKMSAEIRECL
jgi:hypothetical protein